MGSYDDQGDETYADTINMLDEMPTYRIFTKADTNFSLAVRDGQVILAPNCPTDNAQHWIREEKYSNNLRDEEGFPCFALVNKDTHQALKHASGSFQPVKLVGYNPDELDGSTLWTKSNEISDGHRAIRQLNNIRLNMDADLSNGPIRDGTRVVLFEWNSGDNQQWMIENHCMF